MDGLSPGKNEGKGTLIDLKTLVVPKDEEDVFMSTNKDVDIIKLFVNLPALSEMTCPLTVSNIQQHQAGYHTLVQTALVQFPNYPIKMINGRNLVCYCEDSNVVNEDDWKICIP